MIRSKEPQIDSQSDNTGYTENDTPTQKSIMCEKNKYCDQLYILAGEVKKWEESYEENWKLSNEKRCLFVDIEYNYHILRNYIILYGSKFTQTNELIKDNITQYISRNTTLATTLKSIALEISSLKTKLMELRDQACKLEACRDDSCNITQWNKLTGDSSKNQYSQSKNVNPNQTEDYFNQLICMPKSLAADVDSLFKSSADVKGIHVFSNMSALESMRLKLAESTQQLSTHMQNASQLREADLKKIQEELIQIIKDRVKSNVSKYDARSNFEGLKEAVDYICCKDNKCECDCINNETDCDPRLKNCEKEICSICSQVKTIYCPEHRQHDHQQNDYKQSEE